MTDVQTQGRSGLLSRFLELAWQISGAFRLLAFMRGNRIALSASVVSPFRLFLGKGVTIQRGAIVHCGGKRWNAYRGQVRIGRHAVVGPYCIVYGSGGIDIGDFTHLGPGVQLISQAGLHDENRLCAVPSFRFDPIRIGPGCWIGVGSVVLGGARIGRCVTIAPNSVVMDDIPDYAVAAGNPARVMRKNDKLSNDSDCGDI